MELKKLKKELDNEATDTTTAPVPKTTTTPKPGKGLALADILQNVTKQTASAFADSSGIPSN